MLEALATDQVALATVSLLGVSMGLTACTFTCLPFMGTWALGRELHAGRSWLSHWLLWSAAAVLIVLCLRRIWLAIL